jgi:dienelactone hydrolase
VDYLHARLPWPVLVTGFCLGGGMAMYAETTGMKLAGVVGFYAWTGEIGRSPALPHEFAAEIRCPVLGLFGDADHAIAVDVPRALDEQMTGQAYRTRWSSTQESRGRAADRSGDLVCAGAGPRGDLAG